MSTMDDDGTLDGVNDSVTNDGTGTTLLFQMKVETVPTHHIILATVLNSSISNIKNGIIWFIGIEGTDMKTTFILESGINMTISKDGLIEWRSVDS